MKKPLALSGYSLYPGPAQPAAGRKGGPRLGLLGGFIGNTGCSMEGLLSRPAVPLAARQWQARAAGAAKTTPQPERSQQHGMPVAGAAGRPTLIKYAGQNWPRISCQLSWRLSLLPMIDTSAVAAKLLPWRQNGERTDWPYPSDP